MSRIKCAGCGRDAGIEVKESYNIGKTIEGIPRQHFEGKWHFLMNIDGDSYWVCSLCAFKISKGVDIILDVIDLPYLLFDGLKKMGKGK